MLSLPIYRRGPAFYLHTRLHGRQFKRSLHTADRTEAIIRAVALIQELQMAKTIDDFDFSGVNPRRYEIDLARGVAKADSPEDHQRLLETLKVLQALGTTSAPAKAVITAPAAAVGTDTGLTLLGLLDKYLSLKKIRPATVLSYRQAAEEFAAFVGETKTLAQILGVDVTNWQEHLIQKQGNTQRTVDNKVGNIRAIFNFGLKQRFFAGENPAAKRDLLSKREKRRGGFGFYEWEDVVRLYQSDFFAQQRTKDPHYYWVNVLGLVTGARVSELTALTAADIKTDRHGNRYLKVQDAKTEAGIREMPVPDELWTDYGFGEFLPQSGRLFRYVVREGKGSGNAVGKKFSRQLAAAGVVGRKLVFHSLRKFVNDFMQKEGVPLEPRCELMGHETESVNVQVYAKRYSVAQLATIVRPAQLVLLGIFPKPIK